MINTNQLKARIVGAGMTQGDLAKAVEMTEKTLSVKINGHRPFDILEAVKICEALEITDNNEKASIFLRSISQ